MRRQNSCGVFAVSGIVLDAHEVFWHVRYFRCWDCKLFPVVLLLVKARHWNSLNGGMWVTQFECGVGYQRANMFLKFSQIGNNVVLSKPKAFLVALLLSD